MKEKVTKKEIRTTNARIICVPYCALQSLLATETPFAYSTRREGWACDYYQIPREICISTGYAPIGKHMDYDFLDSYEKAARKICEETWEYQERKRRLDALIEDFAGDVERLYFNGKER